MRLKRSAVLLPLVLFFAAACGRKAMPVAPQQPAFTAVSALEGRLVDGVAYLSWRATVPAGYKSGQCVFKVFRARHPLSGNGCDGCPLDFRTAGEVSSSGSVRNDDGSVLARYKERVEKGYRYTYYVVCSCNGVDIGPECKRVVIDYE